MGWDVAPLGVMGCDVAPSGAEKERRTHRGLQRGHDPIGVKKTRYSPAAGGHSPIGGLRKPHSG